MILFSWKRFEYLVCNFSSNNFTKLEVYKEFTEGSDLDRDPPMGHPKSKISRKQRTPRKQRPCESIGFLAILLSWTQTENQTILKDSISVRQQTANDFVLQYNGEMEEDFLGGFLEEGLI